MNALRARWQEALGTQVSTEALQQAALGKVSGKITEWLKSKSLDRQPRVAQQLRVDRGWERAVETVLGSYLEAVCVDGLDSVTDLLASFDGGHLAVVSLSEAAAVPGVIHVARNPRRLRGLYTQLRNIIHIREIAGLLPVAKDRRRGAR